MTNGLTLAAIFLAATCVCISDGLLAQQGNQPKDGIVSVTLTVVDPEGVPIEGATIKPLMVEFFNNDRFRLGWSGLKFEKDRKYVTDQNGEAVFSFPDIFDGKHEVLGVTVSIQHPGFVVLEHVVYKPSKTIRVEMKRGFQIAATAIDAETGELIKTDLYATIDYWEPLGWVLKENGTLVSPVFEDFGNCFRLIQIVDEKAVRFSDLIPIISDGRNRVIFNDVKMYKSIQLQGRLDDQVPRPVQRGYIVASAAKLGDEFLMTRAFGWSWVAGAEIMEDGTFEIDGIPADSIIQVMAICDGWTSTPMSDKERDMIFPGAVKSDETVQMSQMIYVGDDLPDPVVAMRPTSQCLVTVLDSEGNPIEGANVFPNSSRRFFYCLNVLRFDAFRLSAKLHTESRKAGDNANGQSIGFHKFKSYGVKTNEQGIALLTDFPVGPNHVGVSHSDYTPENDQLSSLVRFNAESGKQAELTVTLKKSVKESKPNESTADQKGVGNDGKQDR